ncbi:putative testis-specific Y-encoded-like protein 3 [Acipenser ruthenus]|uniref:putative testis-specific Y-encoded-like protein 3 n=1 Tax=Acipenser ruthenus TaxID=7906 RepID=UPI0027420092|nr:putative testis-specific Y-encoded-like protein 3 [Acipenser ruthenus]
MSDCSENGESEPKRQRASPSPERAAPATKRAKLENTEGEPLLSPPPLNGEPQKIKINNADKKKKEEEEAAEEKAREWESASPTAAPAGDAPPPGSGGSARLKETEALDSDWAAMAAAEALASLTRGGGTAKEATLKAQSKRKPAKSGKKPEDCVGGGPSGRWGSREGSPEKAGKPLKTGAVVDSEGFEVIDTSVEDEEAEAEAASSSPAASSSENAEDAECAIVSVETRVAPETRRSLATLVQIQGELEEIEKRAARLYRRMELKFNRMRRPHVEKRHAVIQGIPGFWVTAFLNHPQLSAHIDEHDEDALSFMTNLEVENFKGTRLGYRICFHFSRNPYFQNEVLVKEFHLRANGASISFSNPICWLRGRNLASHSGMVKGPGSLRVYQSFFSWFTDHSSPTTDEIAELLKDDLWKNPLQYYLLPLSQSAQNGRQVGNGDECVVISDSDEEVPAEDKSKEEGSEEGESSEEDTQADGEVVIDGSEDSGSGEEKEGEEEEEEEEEGVSDEQDEVDVEELDESLGGKGQEAEVKGEDEEDQEDIEVDGDEDI